MKALHTDIRYDIIAIYLTSPNTAYTEQNIVDTTTSICDEGGTV
jgi:hypothetical protein